MIASNLSAVLVASLFFFFLVLLSGTTCSSFGLCPALSLGNDRR